MNTNAIKPKPWAVKLSCFILFFTAIAVEVIAAEPNSEFEQWMQRQSQGLQTQKKEFQEYKDQRDKEFTAFLKANWKAVDIVEGDVRDESPKPVVMPVAPVKPVSIVPVKNPVIVSVPKPVVDKPVLAPVTSVKGKLLVVDFYGKQLRLYYDALLKKNLSAKINKESISDYWSALSRADYDNLGDQLTKQKKSLQLNDWAFASLVNTVALSINQQHKNEGVLLSWFLLVKSGYKARIAYDRSSIYLLLPSQHEMFDVPFFTYNDKRYYTVSFDGLKQRPGQVYTYDGEYPQTTKILDMQVDSVVASSDHSERRHLSFKFEGKSYNIDVAYDRGRIKFFSTYPQLNLNLYFAAGVYKMTATPLQKQLAAHMFGMSEQQAVNFLLRFVQTSLKYETDENQFGEENYLFPEESLFYPYSDCEDRAILFAWLVSSLLDLKVIGLDYPGHVAAAVQFNEEITGDSISYQGRRYIVTDPTYINANAGMTMPDYKKYKPEVIAY